MTAGRRRLAFGWYGGKYSHLDWLLPLLPAAHHYCEPFGGSGAVLINRAPAPVETYNDLDGEVVNFFAALREDGEALERALTLTPFSREEFARSLEIDPALPRLERARRFYVRARQVRTGLAQSATVGRWANCRDTSRGGMAGAVSRWVRGVEGLAELAERWRRVQVENRPAVDVVATYDSKRTLFYCDPPYVHGTRGDAKAYAHEMTDEEHRDLAGVLARAKGKVALSNYECDLMDELYPAPKWTKRLGRERTNHATKGRRREVLWTNY